MIKAPSDQPKYYLRSYARLQKDRTLSIKDVVTSKQATEGLHHQGYQIFKGAIKLDDRLPDFALKQARQGAKAIFNHNESNGRDDRRRQQRNLPLNTKYMQAFDDQVQSFVKQHVNTKLSPSDPVILRSMPGCQPQAAHTDYEPDKLLKAVSDENMPLALIVCLMEGTSLRVWPNSVRLATSNAKSLEGVKPISCKQVSLSPGDILVFRGDFVHAGSAYEQENCRIHYYLDSPLVPRTKNRTWLIDKQASQAMRDIIQPDLPSSKLRMSSN